ncbi:hypothetical protein D3C75_1137080 [compost metagenome]
MQFDIYEFILSSCINNAIDIYRIHARLYFCECVQCDITFVGLGIQEVLENLEKDIK